MPPRNTRTTPTGQTPTRSDNAEQLVRLIERQVATNSVIETGLHNPNILMTMPQLAGILETARLASQQLTSNTHHRERHLDFTLKEDPTNMTRVAHAVQRAQDNERFRAR